MKETVYKSSLANARAVLSTSVVLKARSKPITAFQTGGQASRRKATISSSDLSGS